MTDQDDPTPAPLVITELTQFRGNRVISHLYLEQYMRVLHARHQARRYAEERD